MRLPVLRETRMPAVLVTLGDVQRVVDHVPYLVTQCRRRPRALGATAAVSVQSHPVDERVPLRAPRTM